MNVQTSIDMEQRTPVPRRVLPYGTWPSPVTAATLTTEAVGLSEPRPNGADTLWLESRPQQRRTVLVRHSAAGIVDVTGDDIDVRTRVHEYGGGAYSVDADEAYVSHFGDGRLRRVDASGEATVLTAGRDLRFADMVVDRRRERLVAVMEDHRQADAEATNSLVTIPLRGGEPRTLCAGEDFYSSPALSPDGARLAWLSWNHPNMPWDGNQLWVAELDAGGAIGSAQCISGVGSSSFQPQWSPNGVLHCTDDRTGWSVLYRLEQNGELRRVLDADADIGMPQWGFGMSRYAFVNGGLVCAMRERGRDRLLLVQADGQQSLDVPWVVMNGLRTHGDRLVLMAGGEATPSSVVEVDVTTGEHRVLRRSTEARLAEDDISRARAVEFPTSRGRTAHAFFYPPVNAEVTGPQRERPPLVVRSHGGPTSAASPSLELSVQFWTTRGFAVADVNYGGSTGYGREYRQRLDGEWGVVDVEDCENAARHLAAEGDVDGQRCVIEGGSAGGYTTLRALSTSDFYRAGCSRFGIADLETFRHDTHKFESRYDLRLIGPYPERRDLFVERSPIHNADRITRPLLLLQGLDDRIVPPSQSEVIFHALRGQGTPCAYIAFAGEGHGFRGAHAIQRSVEAALWLYCWALGIHRDDLGEPLDMHGAAHRD